MNRYLATLRKLHSSSSDDSPEAQPPVCPSEYAALIQRLFETACVVAVIGAGSGHGVTGICEGIASELSRLGRRVALVSVSALLQANPKALSNETTSLRGVGRNVRLWPSNAGQQIEFFKSRFPVEAKNWLEALREDFDAVLLDCPALETAPGGAAIAAMAEAAVLAVDATHTPKHQILLDQRILLLNGVKLAGCILIHAK